MTTSIYMQVSGLINELTTLKQAAEYTNDIYRARAYAAAISKLKRLSQTITLADVTGIGRGIHARIAEYARTGHITEAIEARQVVAAYAELSAVKGAGPATVKSWIEAGIISVAQLRRAVGRGDVTLTTMQRYGLLYYSDLTQRIPRAEVAELGRYVRTRLLLLDPDIILEVAGSYRRGHSDSGDVDILISNRARYDDSLLHMLAASLADDPNYIVALINGKERLTFLYNSNGVVRQIDVLNIAYSTYYAALLYFTGSWEFNEAMRGRAKREGYKLNQRGLYRLTRGRLVLVPTASEEEIFRIIGLLYVNPQGRD
jgi:DNA polymerase/3'-5' exonuclease PolX